MKKYALGFFVGVIFALLIIGTVSALRFFNKRDKELIEYAKNQMEIEALQEEYRNRDPVEFLEIPDVRRAADGATAEFERKRDEAVYRFRNRLTY